MDADLRQRICYQMKILQRERNKYMQQLESCEGFAEIKLRKKKKSRGGCYFYAKKRGSDKYVYVGNKNAPDVVKIRKARYLKEAIRRIDKDIELLKTLNNEYLPYDKYSVNAWLPEIYQTDVAPMDKAYEREGAAWKEKKLAFQAGFPENYPERKRETTSDGVKVKTISEVVLYEMIKSAGLYAIYELPLIMNDYGPNMYPDLTVLSPIDMKTEIIIEYVGRLDLPKYREDFARRIDRYLLNGYVPGVNLFFVYGDREGHIDSMQINKVIADICGLN